MRILITLLVSSLLLCIQAVDIDRRSDRIRITLDEGVVLDFVLHGDHLLGLSSAEVQGVAMTAPATCLRPVLAQDLGPTPVFTHDLLLQEIVSRPDSVTLVCQVRMTGDRAALQRFYTMEPDPSAVDHDEELNRLQAAATKAEDDLRALALAEHEKCAKALARLEAVQAEAAEKTDHETRLIYRQRIGNLTTALERIIKRTLGKELADHPKVRDLRQTIAAYDQELADRATAHLRIHRDYFGHAMIGLPAEITSRANLQALSQMPGEACGELRWTFTTERANIAGQDWRGWRQQVSYRGSEDSQPVRVLRQQGTWELDGKAIGSTVVAMRYRGLGSIEETFADDGNGGVDRCFTTTEMIPGAAQGSPVISPAIPESITVGDRGYGLEHRLSAWIGVMARGGGANVVDFQYRPHACMASFPLRQGNLRGCTEAYPGDRYISQRDEEWFALSRRFTSTPTIHLLLATPQQATRWQSITRWQEVDQYVRDLLSEELDFIHPEPLPAAGYNLDYAWHSRLPRITQQIDEILGPAGVRMILQHHPGWINGRGLGSAKDPRAAGGGDCAIYDYRAEGATAAAWKDLQDSANKWDMDYYAWVSTIAHKVGPLAREIDLQQVGDPLISWAEFGNGRFNRGRSLYSFDILNPLFAQVFNQRMDLARRQLGYQGIWADSWQKWLISLSTYADGRPPMARKWWEHYARWSRRGVGLVAESQAFPGLSCSIELPNHDFDDEWWFMRYTVKWYRGGSRPPGDGTPAATQFMFRMMANKCTICWDVERQSTLESTVPEYTRLAHEYLAALPTMQRSWVLPDGTGMLWLGHANDTEGVWYPFVDADAPTGVRLTAIASDETSNQAKAWHTYRVVAKDLLDAFGIQRGPLTDPRIGQVKQRFVSARPESPAGNQ